MEAVAVIQELTPYPGNEFSNEQTNYVVPDVYLHKIDGEFVIQLNDDACPSCSSPVSISSCSSKKEISTTESRGYLRENKRNAEWFIKSIEQRQRTIYRVMESILKFQHDFLKPGQRP